MKFYLIMFLSNWQNTNTLYAIKGKGYLPDFLKLPLRILLILSSCQLPVTWCLTGLLFLSLCICVLLQMQKMFFDFLIFCFCLHVCLSFPCPLSVLMQYKICNTCWLFFPPYIHIWSNHILSLLKSLCLYL